MDKESDDYKNEDYIEENRMLDNLSWALNFMRRYEKKKEDFQIRRALEKFLAR